jgi:hypothetical protein
MDFSRDTFNSKLLDIIVCRDISSSVTLFSTFLRVEISR